MQVSKDAQQRRGALRKGGGYLRIDEAAGVELAAEVVWSAVEPAATALGRVILAVVDPGYSPVKPGYARSGSAQVGPGCVQVKPGSARRSFRAEVWGLVFGVLPLMGAGLFGRLLTCIFG